MRPAADPTSAATAPRRGFQVVAKPSGPLCNLGCRYCFYLEKEKLYAGTPAWKMDERVLDVFIRDYIAAQDAPTVGFVWQGGEPTLIGLDFFRRAVELQRRYAGGKRIENALQTNGVLLDDEWGAFLAREGFLVGLSIDGPRALHDRHRVDRGGQPTFDRVIKGLEVLRNHGVAFNTLTAVHRQNAKAPLDVYRFLKDAGSAYQQFIPIVERLDGPGHLALPGVSGAGRVSSWAVEAADWGNFLCAIFDEWVRHDVGRVFVQLFDIALESWYTGESSLCIFRPTCGRALAVEHNGDLYPCDHYVFPEYRLGNLTETPVEGLVESPAQTAFGDAKRDTLPAYCRNCEVLFACHGECPKNRFIDSPDGEPGLNYLCAGFRRFFTHVAPAMQFMAGELARERPPANVMAWARDRDRAAASAAAGRNEPCPCGSGRKFKRCCGAMPPNS